MTRNRLRRARLSAITAGAAVAVVLAALIADLATAGRALAADPRDPEQVALGEQIYRDHCASCQADDQPGARCIEDLARRGEPDAVTPFLSSGVS